MNDHPRAIIADDEKALRDHLRASLARLWPELVLCAEAANGLEAAERIAALRPDVAFLDIRMPGLSGLEVASKVPESCRVVFVTAYDDYAIKAFENAALDYLLKPFTDARLAKTIARLKDSMSMNSSFQSDLRSVVEAMLREADSRRRTPFLEWVRVQIGEEIKLVSVEEICYFQASDKYTIVMTVAREYLIRAAIRQLAAELDPNTFWQIHRKTIVNARHIATVGRSLTGRFVVHLKNRSETLTVSRPYNHLFKQM